MYLLSQWDPPALEYVTNDLVDAYFAPLGDLEPELKLPTESREAFVWLQIILRTGLRPDKRVIICVAIIFGSTASPVEPTIHVPYTRFGALNFERQWELSVFVMSTLRPCFPKPNEVTCQQKNYSFACSEEERIRVSWHETSKCCFPYLGKQMKTALSQFS